VAGFSWYCNEGAGCIKQGMSLFAEGSLTFRKVAAS
jgi:hypothetical protein